MTAQLALDFAVWPTALSALCIWERHCGARMEIGPPERISARSHAP